MSRTQQKKETPEQRKHRLELEKMKKNLEQETDVRMDAQNVIQHQEKEIEGLKGDIEGLRKMLENVKTESIIHMDKYKELSDILSKRKPLEIMIGFVIDQMKPYNLTEQRFILEQINVQICQVWQEDLDNMEGNMKSYIKIVNEQKDNMGRFKSVLNNLDKVVPINI